MRILRRTPLISFITVLALCPLQLRADDIPSRVPADAILYLQWKGAETLGNAYKSSHTKALLDAFALPKIFRQYMDDQASKESDPAKLADMQLVHELVDIASQSGVSLYVGPVDFANPDLPVPKLALFSNIGMDRAAALAPKIRSLYERNKNDTSPPFTSLQVGDYLVVSIGSDVEVDKRLVGPVPTDGLAETASFKNAIAQLGPHPSDDAVLIYLNAEAALKMADDFVASRNTAGTSPWPLIEQALGITELKQIAVTGDFDNQNWLSQCYIGMTDQRFGLLSLLDNPPLNAENFKLIPSSAAWATLYRFDAAKLLEEFRDVAAQTGPQGTREFNTVLQQFYAYTGVDLKADLLDSMGDTYAFYQSPDSVGRSFNSFTFVSPLKNAPKFEAAINTLETFTNEMIKQRSAGAPLLIKNESLDAPDEKITAHLIPLETITPTWAIANGTLYVSTSRADVQSAIDNAGKTGPLTDNPAFKSLYKSLAQDPVSTFTFIDFPKVAAEMNVDIADIIKTQNTLHPDDPVNYQLPPIATINPNLAPALRVSWTDTAGWHLKSVGPFPFSTRVSPQSLILEYLSLREQQHHEAKLAPPPSPTPAP